MREKDMRGKGTQENGSAELHLQEVTKRYGQDTVIHGVSVCLNPGEFVVIVGPSGCGKSTLLRMIAGLEEISSGTIAIAGRVVNRLEPRDRNIAMVFQNYALYPHMSVFENMAYGLRIAGLSKTEIRTRVDEVARMLELETLLARKPRQLSGGQRQRVAMGRAIVRDPAVFLFDEPLSNLDAKLRVQMRLEIKQLHRKLQVTSVYVTHDQVEAMTLADRLLVMNQGVIEQIGTPIEIYQYPQTLFVARFIGSPAMNLLQGRISADGTLVELPGGERLPLAQPLRRSAGQSVTIGIRPEHFLPAGSTAWTVQLVVDVVEHLGADTLLYGHFGTHPTALTARLPGTATVSTGAVLTLSVDPDRIHVFSADEGRRLPYPPADAGGFEADRPAAADGIEHACASTTVASEP
jgi:sn-glycerol 3-phosphate transport system ATP-binding protein